MMEFDELNRRNSAIPILFFTHDSYLRDYTGTDAKFRNHGRAKIVFLIRDPRDTAVSQYFRCKHHIRPRKNDPSSFKVRRGKVGGWRDHLTPEEAERIDRMIHADLALSIFPLSS